MLVRLATTFTAPGVEFPRAPLSDDFNRADADTLGSTSVGAQPWALSFGGGVSAATFGIDNNAGRIKAITGAGYAAALIDTGYVDHQVSFKLMNTPTVAARWFIAATDADNALVVRPGTGTIAITRIVGGSAVNIATPAATLAVGTVIRAHYTGTTLNLYIDNVLIWSGAASLPGSPTRAGFGSYSSGSVGRIDDFVVTYP